MGSWADWVSGLSSVVATTTALCFWYRERVDAGIEKMTDVSLWVQQDFPPDGKWFVVSVNNSNSPVWKWAAIFRWQAGGEYCEEIITATKAGLLPPGTNQFVWRPCLPPERETSVAMEFVFEDTQGRCWRRSLGENLKKTKSFEKFLQSIGYVSR